MHGNRKWKEDWLSYYSRKRIVHQWTQLDMLGSADCHKVLEIGPGQGLVTAMLLNAGYDVTTLDMIPPVFSSPVVPHILKDLREAVPQDLSGFDAIVCCEMLEHIDWEDVGAALKLYRDSGAKYLVISVPYMGFQLAFDCYLNRHVAKHYFSLKKFLHLKDFQRQPPGGHQWEVGYKGYSLATWEKRLADCGWKINRREFTAHCRSVFHLLEAA